MVVEVTRAYQVVASECAPVGDGAAYQQVGLIGRSNIRICLHISVHGKIAQCFPVAEQVVGVAAQHTGGKVNHPVAVGEIGFHIIKVETGGKGIGGLAGEMVFGDGISVVRNQFHSLQEVTLHFPVHFFQRAALVTGRHGGFHVFHIGDSQRFGGMSVISIAEDSCQHEMAVGTAHQCFTALRVERCRISFLLYRLECHVGG